MFDWDSANIAHIARHKISPEEAEEMIENDPIDLPRQIESGEERFPHLGETFAGRPLIVILTVRGDKDRVVTAFEPSKQLRAFYLRQKEKRHGKSTQDPDF